MSDEPAMAAFLASEEWRDVLAYGGLYQVSDQGRVRSLRHRTQWWDRLRDEPRILWATSSGRGYLSVRLFTNLQGRRHYVHVLVLTAFSGPAPPGHLARHLNGRMMDNRASNLAWGTPAENAADRTAHGTQMRGEGHTGAVLAAADVVEIRKRYAAGETQPSIATAFGVSPSNVSRIVRREAWKHIK